MDGIRTYGTAKHNVFRASELMTLTVAKNEPSRCRPGNRLGQTDQANLKVLR